MSNPIELCLEALPTDSGGVSTFTRCVALSIGVSWLGISVAGVVWCESARGSPLRSWWAPRAG